MPYVEDNTCKKCRKEYFIYNNTCVKSCPDNVHLPKLYDICPYTASVTGIGDFPFTLESACMQMCPDSHYNVNNTCIEKDCIGPYYSFSFIRTIRECPTFSNWKTKYVRFRFCLEKCPENTVIAGRACLRKCPYATLLVRGQCLNESYCPSDLPFIEYTAHGRNCTNQCKDKEYRFGSKCLPICTTYSDEDKTDEYGDHVCSMTCPRSLLLVDGNRCSRSCPGRQVVLDGRCIQLEDCVGLVMEPGRICKENQNACPPSYYPTVYGYIRVRNVPDDLAVTACRPTR